MKSAARSATIITAGWMFDENVGFINMSWLTGWTPDTSHLVEWPRYRRHGGNGMVALATPSRTSSEINDVILDNGGDQSKHSIREVEAPLTIPPSHPSKVQNHVRHA